MRDTYLRGQAAPTADPVLAGMDEMQRYYHLRARAQLIQREEERRRLACAEALREWAARGVDLRKAEAE